LITIPIALAVVAMTIAVHYEALRAISAMIPRAPGPLRARVLLVVLGCFAAHMIEIGIYAAAYWLIDTLGWGSIEGNLEGRAVDYFYFSATCFSTLGFGDVYPTGAARVLSGLEAVNGLFLIAWSTSFTYLSMERLWPLHSRVTMKDNGLRDTAE
jgi:hypothetical protein